jgi:carboxyl-terminal processing protease
MRECTVCLNQAGTGLDGKDVRTLDNGNQTELQNEFDKDQKEIKQKNKFWKGVLVGTLVTAFAGLIVVGAAAFMLMIGRVVIREQTQTSVESEQGDGELNLRRIQRKVNTVESLVDRYFLFDIDSEKQEDGIYKGLVDGLDDPYSIYYTAEEYQKLTEDTMGTYCGIGAMVSQNIETKVVMIVRVFHDSPAEEAGLQKGDIIYKVNGVDAAEEDLDILVKEQIRGEEGTSTHLTLLRGTETIEVDVTRRPVDVDTVDYQMMADGETGYIMVMQFDLVTNDQFRTAMEALQDQGMKRLIIDLRDNPGGVLDTAVDMLSYLLPDDQYDGTLVSTKNREGKGERFYSADGKVYSEVNDGGKPNPQYPKDDMHEVDIPTVILVNGNSASASEVFSGAMRDYGRAKLVGTTTFGKGIVQGVFSLGDGSAVKLTTAHYYTPSGFDLHGRGLEPDVEVEFEVPKDYETEGLTLENDNQVQKALEVLDDMK